MGTIHRIPGEVRHYEANEALCNARQETREIVYVTESGLLRYKREDGTYMYVGASGNIGPIGPSGTVDYSQVLVLNQSTPQSVINGVPHIVNGIKTSKIYPSGNSTTAIQILRSNGTTSIVNVDTTNSRVGVGLTNPARLLDIYNGGYGQYKYYLNLAANDRVNNYSTVIEYSADGNAFPRGNANNFSVYVATGKAVTGQFIAYENFITKRGAGTLHQLTGMLTTIDDQLGTLTDCFGYNIVQYGAFAGTITNFYAYYMPAFTVTGAGVITNRYGVYIADTIAKNIFMGSMGIAVADPDEALEVNGNIRLTSDNNKYYLGTAKDASLTYDGTNLIINPKEVGTGYVDVQGSLVTSGNVGVGTNNPATLLEVSKNDPTEVATRIYNTNTSGVAILALKASSTDAQLKLDSVNNLLSLFTVDADDMSIYTKDNSPQIYLKQSNGNVGIGTSAPDEKVDLVGGRLRVVRNSDDNNIIYMYGADTTTEYFGLGIGSGIAIITAGGAGTTNNSLSFRTSLNGTEAEKMRINTSGYVGINTTTPLATLDVNGTVIGQYKSSDGTAGITATGVFTTFTIKNGLIVAAS